MFVERLQNEHFQYFLDKELGNIKTKDPNVHNFFKNIKIKLINGNIVLETKFNTYTFSDFNFSTSEFNKDEDAETLENLNKSWKQFLYGFFKERYKKEILKIRQSKREEALKEFKKKFDDETKKITDDLIS